LAKEEGARVVEADGEWTEAEVTGKYNVITI